MLTYISAVGFRYFSIGLQFAIVVLITRTLSPAGSGSYFLILGVVSSTYYLAGFGLPDGLVKSIALARASDDEGLVRTLVEKSWAATAALSLALAGAGSLGAYFAGLPSAQVAVSAIWWLCYGAIFFCAQCLLAMGRASLGSFFFYPATNIFQIVFLLPFLLLHKDAGLSGVLAVTVISALSCAAVAAGFLVWAISRFPRGPGSVSLVPAFSLGIVICISRVLQSALYWIPVWMTGALQGAAAAGLIAVASRLAVAVASLMAAIRFTVRPEIVAAAARGDWHEIERKGRAIASVASFAAFAALVGALAVGAPLIALLFGEVYRPAAAILCVLLLGTLGECFGGPVDEVLRMTGRSHIVLGLLAIFAVAETVLIAGLGGSPLSAAMAQSIALIGMYALLVTYLKAKNSILIVPYFSLRALAGAL